MTKFYWILGAVAILGVGAVGYSVGSKHLEKATTEPVDVPGLDDMSTLVEKAQGVTMGSPDAPVTIAEFGDYMCPACGDFTLTIKPRIVSEFVKTGKAKFIFYDFPLISIHPNSFIAARAARCAEDQDQYWEYQAELYRHQTQWTPEKQPVDKFVQYADSVGLDKGEFETCVKSDAHADLVSANLRLAEELGLSGTPTIMVHAGQGGMPRRLADFDYATIEAQVDSLLAGTGEGGS